MKKVMKCMYVHKSNWEELFEALPFDLKEKANELFTFFNEFATFEVIKFDSNKRTLSFIQSPDWDTANEPIVGNSVIYYLDTGDHQLDMQYKIIKGRTKNPQIYHSKEQFVAPNYDGFDIQKAKERTRQWNSLPNIDKKRIGNKDFWVAFLKANNMEV